LLRRFRHPDGRPLVGFDRGADAALLAGAPAAWDGAPERLVRLPFAMPHGFHADARLLLLAPPDAEDPGGVSKARIILLLGAAKGAVERHDLLVPRPRFEQLHEALRGSAEFLAGAASGRWLARALAISADMASVALLPEDGQTFGPPLLVPAAALLHDLPNRAGPDGLDLSGTGRARLLLGTAPARLRVFLRGDASGAALFQDGQRLPATPPSACATGEVGLEAEPRPGGNAAAAVFGVAVPAPARVAITRLELVP
jgi:hypothetical protein